MISYNIKDLELWREGGLKAVDARCYNSSQSEISCSSRADQSAIAARTQT
jgi:hypothetical protein